MIRSLSFLAVATLLGSAPMAAEYRPGEHRNDFEEGFSDRLIVKYRGGQGGGARNDMARRVAANRAGVTLDLHRQTASGAQVLRLNRTLRHDQLLAIAASLRNGDADVEYAEPDVILHAALTPTDPRLAEQWSLSDATGGIRAPAAWDRATGKGLVVAVIDTGVRPHLDLKSKLLPGYDFVSTLSMAGDGSARDADASDPGDFTTANQCAANTAARSSSWHGTHVAGIVAAAANNSQGVAGVAFNARVLPVRALGRCGGYTSDIADAIQWAAGVTVTGVAVNANPAKVLNLSLGGAGTCSATAQNAINAARAKGAVVVVAAGNDKTDVAKSQPANCNGVIAVAATNKAGARASYSNFGAKVTLAAPGGDTNAAGGGILSTHNTGTTIPGADSYANLMGTSMATPVVSGVAALVLEANPKLTPDQVAEVLKASSRAFPAACVGCGSGIVNAEAAVARALGTPTTIPAPSPAPTPAPAPTPTTPSTVAEVENNNTLASAQRLAAVPVTVSAGLSATSDVDHFRVSVPAGRVLTVRLATGSASGFGLAALTAQGSTLLQRSATLGQTTQFSITNGGSAATELVLRVNRSTGSAGAYTLAFSL